MTELSKPVRRQTRGALDGCYGCDRGRRLVASLEVGDLLTIRPAGTRRAETVSLFDVYRWAMQRRVNAVKMQKLRDRKAKIETRKAAAKWRREIAKPV